MWNLNARVGFEQFIAQPERLTHRVRLLQLGDHTANFESPDKRTGDFADVGPVSRDVDPAVPV